MDAPVHIAKPLGRIMRGAMRRKRACILNPFVIDLGFLYADVQENRGTGTTNKNLQAAVGQRLLSVNTCCHYDSPASTKGQRNKTIRRGTNANA
jgi:hypothetical protein